MNELKLVIKSVLGEEKKVLAEIDHLLRRHPFSIEDCYELKSAIAEACLNAMEHGNWLSPELDVHIQISVYSDTVKVFISDQALGSRSLGKNQASSDRGWGILFISQFMDSYHSCCLEQKNVFYMEKKMRKEEVPSNDCRA